MELQRALVHIFSKQPGFMPALPLAGDAIALLFQGELYAVALLPSGQLQLFQYTGYQQGQALLPADITQAFTRAFTDGLTDYLGAVAQAGNLTLLPDTLKNLALARLHQPGTPEPAR